MNSVTTPAPRRATPALRLAAIRQIHLYFGVFIAPSLLFFAFTGALQLFGLHEAHGGYTPPALIEKLSSVHKDQVLEHPRGPPPPGVIPADGDAADHHPGADDHHPGEDDHHPDRPPPKAFVLKVFFLVVALGLIVSTSLGLWMGLRYGRNRRLAWGLLAAGTLIPVLALLL